METESRQEKLEELRKFWKAHLDKWEASGLPQKEYWIVQIFSSLSSRPSKKIASWEIVRDQF